MHRIHDKSPQRKGSNGPEEFAVKEHRERHIFRNLRNLNNEEQERRKRKALFGVRASSRIFESHASTGKNQWNSSNKVSQEDSNKGEIIQMSCKEKIIIKQNNRYKAVFDIFILWLVMYSCFTNVYYVAFSSPTNEVWLLFDNIVDITFGIDLILNFLQSYIDQENFEVVKDLKKIAKQYVFKGWFFVDFVSVFPFYWFIETGQITKLLRLLRLPRLIKLIDISRFNKILKQFLSNDTTSRDEKIVAQYMMLYFYKIFRLFLIAVIITYFIGCTWYATSHTLTQRILGEEIIGSPIIYMPNGDVMQSIADEIPAKENTFLRKFNLFGDDTKESDKVIISCYYALTTLSTVGYGDYYPISDTERIIALIIMLGGVAFFSYIMGNFIEIISNYEKKMGVVDKSGDLHMWLVLLTRFTNNQPLPKNLITQIEKNFKYYWATDRLACVLQNEQGYLETLPNKLKNQIMAVYLFSDIFTQFKRFFHTGCEHETMFLYDVAFGFMPRKFEPTEEDHIIYDEEEDVTEMYFVTDGMVAIAYSINAGYSVKKCSVAKKLVGSFLICDNYVVNNQKSQFIYMAVQRETKAYAISKQFMHQDVFTKYPEIHRKIAEDSSAIYRKNIFKPVNEMRKNEIQMLNKQSFYRTIQFVDVNRESKKQQGNVYQIFQDDEENQFSNRRNEHMEEREMCSKIIEQNFNDNVHLLETDLINISIQVDGLIKKCENEFQKVINDII